MNIIFFTRISDGVRRPTTKAYLPTGRPERSHTDNEARRSTACLWAVVFDPAGTISKDARFGQMDLDNGVEFGSWEHGTIFEHLSSHQLFCFDKPLGKIRQVKGDMAEANAV